MDCELLKVDNQPPPPATTGPARGEEEDEEHVANEAVSDQEIDWELDDDDVVEEDLGPG